MRFLRFAFKSALRNPVRSGLTVVGVAVAIFLFTAVMSLNHGMERMLRTSAQDDTLVVFDRYQGCPPLSKLPVSHQRQIEALPGVVETSSTLFLLSACSRATDLVAVHGIEPATFRRFQTIDVPDELYVAFSMERGGALVGEPVLRRYGWRVGQSVSVQELGGITFTVRGTFRAPGNSLENAILVNLDYLQFATDQVGIVTRTYVKVADPGQAEALAVRIDEHFAGSAKPTRTMPARTFIAASVSGVTDIVVFSRWLGYVGLGIILLGVGNSVSMSLRDRTREIAILKTIGYRCRHLLGLVLSEAVMVALAGGLLGAALAWLAVHRSGFLLTVEGFTFVPHVSARHLAAALGLAAGVGLVAGLAPSLRAGRMRVVRALREVD